MKHRREKQSHGMSRGVVEHTCHTCDTTPGNCCTVQVRLPQDPVGQANHAIPDARSPAAIMGARRSRKRAGASNAHPVGFTNIERGGYVGKYKS